MSAYETDPRLIDDKGLRGYVQMFVRRIKTGDLGSLPVVVGLLVIWTVFELQNDRFLSAVNLTNLMMQVAAVGTISVGIFLVLLLGEIDLSVGSVSGVTSAIMAVLVVKHGWSGAEGIAAAIAVGALIGAFQGVMFTKFGVPSFVVTLAGLIAWQGLQLQVLGDTGTINLPPSIITDLTSTFFSPVTGWLVAAVVVGAFLLSHVFEYRQRTKAGLRPKPAIEIVARLIVVTVALVFAIAVFNNDRGLPLAVCIFVGFVVFFDLVTRHTRYGRHIYAVGGNAEAARRAGIRVDGVRLTVFMLSSVMAACGGILAASRLISVNQSSGGSDVLLNAIAAAVIGGTSLFGGRGSAYSVLLGMLVIGSISNGLDLLGEPAATKLMITGAVLLIAVTIDAVARRGRQAAGR